MLDSHLVCASGCVVECQICNWEVADSNLGRGYFAPRSTQPSIPPRSVNEYQLRLRRQRQVWRIPLADETQGVQTVIPWQCVLYLSAWDASCGGAMQIDNLYFYFYLFIFSVNFSWVVKTTSFILLCLKKIRYWVCH